MPCIALEVSLKINIILASCEKQETDELRVLVPDLGKSTKSRTIFDIIIVSSSSLGARGSTVMFEDVNTYGNIYDGSVTRRQL